MSEPRYSMHIEWSDEDDAFIVSLPEFGPGFKTHGSTYEEAVRSGRDLLDTLIEMYVEENRVLPTPKKFGITQVA
jgi:predicted RNase H-like HicB family nuclease